ncbi:tRNA uridine-5-carboxymethylaminomethyl(34) synthesis enzyme MnmG [Faecalibaculum rodentium]|jgi:tRNA uridine 5-carboxymethylaminomethyl modification enzyme|uniref:tRNA uridine 5-carboxymethylaminomethyl modification enzyme MnmG n=3 Tax=Faecalibaculum rodentium TaxID=1702221 RepID=A0A140DT64_9FIRM|nr:tRNA uridine-5-carboxymethylaminomethyl(34) synthesis enzyme MnmG [Faecalibaculum rodentium]AMK53841.1 tRNA uridine 5-carboxymethylaminomethyl modification enzyme GidA [Faecalibaculum rodentium]OLU44137.1 tRNA uridine-5-carboxymethylaminomethyl(34) synthesis enzyme MnmG [Faecalibaculum rodentium]
MFDVLVIGAGHAGIEAAAAAARMGANTCLVTMDLSRAGSMPCNPSVGGPAKGIVVREIDALGGVMPRAADATALQFKMLNTSKGPGVQCLRVQSDKLAYSRWMAAFLKQQPHLTVVENRVESLDIEEGAVRGAICRDGTRLCARTVVVTSGTYMQSVVLKGHTATPSGPDGQPASEGLSESLRNAGLRTFRLKTGTPPRVLADSVDLSFGQEQTGSAEFLHFSDDTRPEDVLRPDEQESCTLIWTRPETHRIIREHLTDSAMYSGLVRGKGPRYCPSIEDKLVRFADKERHQLFLEPESRDLDTLYIQGFSTSMPEDVQEQMVHSLPGLEHAVIEKYAYAIEYDAIDPLQLRPSLETRAVSGLFTAGQVNGTSGYEEAAGQGLMAGINAVLKVRNQPPFVLRRDEAYIGVMIDDLVTKGTQEPYRLLTSRAEYRLLLRHDNAADRLSRKGYSLGLISRDRMERLEQRQAESERLKQELEDLHIPPATAHPVLDRLHLDPLRQGASGLDLLKRPNVTTEDLIGPVSDREAAAALEIAVKYEGYIAKARRDADRLAAMEARQIPDDLDYGAIGNLSLEARQKLSAVRPETLGQASRISGVNPADIAVLAVSLAPVEKGDSK